MNHPIISAINKLSALNTNICCWKGFSKIEDTLLGKADLDLFVPADAVAEVDNILRQLKWVSLDPSIKFDGISHYYHFSRGKWYHLHVYSKLRTGISVFKEYAIDSNHIKSSYNLFGVPCCSLDIAYELHLIRIHLRYKIWYSRLFKNKESTKFSREEKFFSTYGNKKIYRDIELLLLKFNIGLICNPSFSSFVVRVFKRVYSKFFKVKKRLGRGRIISLVGSDGAGKSTVLSKLHSFLAREMFVRKLCFGQPSFLIRTAPLWAMRKSFQVLRYRKERGFVHASKGLKPFAPTSILKQIFLISVAFERLAVYREAFSLTKRGCLIVMDRAPALLPGTFDGPGINHGILKNLERHIYSKIGFVDLAISLEVSKDVAIVRNSIREKLNKESDCEISHRHDLFSAYTPSANRVFAIDAEDDIDSVFINCLDVLADELSNG